MKGLAYFEVIVSGAKTDLHSGMFGGAVANPLNALATILASLKGSDGRILIDGFYDPVRPLESWEREEFAKLPFSETDFQAKLGVPSLEGRGRLYHPRTASGPGRPATSTASSAATRALGPRRSSPARPARN